MSKKLIKIISVLVIALTALGLYGCSKKTEAPTASNNQPKQQQEVKKEKVSVRLQWFPQSQFAGYYVAKSKGFYDEAGLDVTVKNGGPDFNGLVEVSDGQTDFATGWVASGIQGVADGLKIASVAQYFPKSMVVLVSKKSSGINSLESMNGKEVGQWGGLFAVPIKVVMRAKNLTPTYVTQGFDMQEFVDDKMKIASAMLYNEYNTILEKGVKAEDLNVFNLADSGAKFPEDGVFASLDTIKNKPETVKKFVEATLKGWNYAIKNADEAVAIVMKEAEAAGVNTTKEHQKSMLEVLAKNIVDQSGTVGSNLTEADFKAVYDALKENKLVGDKEVKYSDYYQPVK